jgi:hypothetical protein
VNVSFPSHLPAVVYDLTGQFGICRKGDVFFLNGGVNNYLFLFDFGMVEVYG